eukprot:5436955-Pyramimonas_sp.AAC.2
MRLVTTQQVAAVKREGKAGNAGRYMRRPHASALKPKLSHKQNKGCAVVYIEVTTVAQTEQRVCRQSRTGQSRAGQYRGAQRYVSPHLASDGVGGVGVAVQQCVDLALPQEAVEHLRGGQGGGQWQHTTCHQLGVAGHVRRLVEQLDSALPPKPPDPGEHLAPGGRTQINRAVMVTIRDTRTSPAPVAHPSVPVST